MVKHLTALATKWMNNTFDLDVEKGSSVQIIITLLVVISYVSCDLLSFFIFLSHEKTRNANYTKVKQLWVVKHGFT